MLRTFTLGRLPSGMGSSQALLRMHMFNMGGDSPVDMPLHGTAEVPRWSRCYPRAGLLSRWIGFPRRLHSPEDAQHASVQELVVQVTLHHVLQFHQSSMVLWRITDARSTGERPPAELLSSKPPVIHEYRQGRCSSCWCTSLAG